MQDFRSFSGEEPSGRGSAGQGEEASARAAQGEAARFAEAARRMAGAFGGRGEEELLAAIYREAERGRRNGTLSDADIDNFAAAVSPMLDAPKRKRLEKIVARLKKIR